MKNQLEQVLINEDYLKDKIYIIRGQKVMLDSDLAKIYGYSTKDFNRQVKNNKEKFDNDFMFQLSKDELDYYLRCNYSTLNKSNNKQGMHYKYRPFVFTESGIYMLMTVLKGPLAIKQSKALIRTFKAMKDYIVENKSIFPYSELKEIESRTSNLESDYEVVRSDLDKVMDNFIDPSTYKEFLILDGKRLEADLAYRKIFKLAKHSIIYIDDYIGIKTLDLLSYANENVAITIISDNKAKPKLKESIVNDFIVQNKTNKLTILKSNNKCHDRFIILDFNTKNERIYHSGSSLKDAGNKITTIMEIADTKQYSSIIKKLFKNPQLILK